MFAPNVSRRVRNLRSSAIRDLLTVAARPEIVSLAGGLPDPELVPRERIRDAADRALSDPAAVQYTETVGCAPLREVLAARESALLGRTVAPAQIVVTHGSQQALSLLAQTLVDPGATVVIEDPAYTGALQVFRAAEAEIVALPLDDGGLRVDHLRDRLRSGLRPVLVHTVSNFHNPASVTMANERRAELAELAQRYGFLVIEDDPYGEIWFDAAPPAPIASWSDRVIRLSSASKILAPALRTGWLSAPPAVVGALELLKQGADLCGSSLTQRMVADLLTDQRWLHGHLDQVRATYRERANALDAHLRSEFGDVLESGATRGGMFCWTRFRDGTDTDALLEAALAAGVAFVPGSAFAIDAGHRDRMRLCFATADPATLAGAVRRLRRAHDDATLAGTGAM